ncbi:MAG: GNAT family N-acetyltransferase [Planctomycetota bacterium]
MLEDSDGPAYRIATARLVLRCYTPSDAPALQAAIDASLPELVPWLPWARSEPLSLAARVESLRQHRGRFDLGEEFVYGIFDRAAQSLIGGCALHVRGAGNAREVGYWISTRARGQGFATEAAGALVRVAFEIDGVERVEIHGDAENAASARIAEKLGFTCDGTLRKRLVRSDGELGDDRVWSLFEHEYARSAAAELEIEAFDALDRALRVRPRRRSAFR